MLTCVAKFFPRERRSLIVISRSCISPFRGLASLPTSVALTANPTPALHLSSGARPLQKKLQPMPLLQSSPSPASLVSVRGAMSMLFLASSFAIGPARL